ncbi:hypothetical protein XSR1_120021 [Xenorhabdus szentirmaii DSM 16338]|uniref:Uncharacterized protein n=1 Tax=Xenorhabdus szentirmaii DSM 16338 TaxID=1427518 RepID=W1ITX0_9GAMM|nr:hypothetical protein XSR1_120021 [Xenorhabdus szentirmaii DSM 16338]
MRINSIIPDKTSEKAVQRAALYQLEPDGDPKGDCGHMRRK